MRRYIVAALLVLMPIGAEAQRQERDSLAGEVGFYMQVPLAKESLTLGQPRFFPQFYQYISKQCGVWGFGYAERYYDSGVAGLYCDVVPNFEVEQAVGGEAMHDSMYVRFGGALLLGDIDKVGVELYYENGASHKPWWQVNALWVLSSTTAVGILGQKDDGIGPRLRISIPDFPLRLWAMYAVNKEQRGNMLFGGEMVFDWKK